MIMTEITKDTIEKDVKSIIYCWISQRNMLEEELRYLTNKFNVHIDYIDEYLINVIDDVTGEIYIYDYSEEEFVIEEYISGEWWDNSEEDCESHIKHVPDHIYKFMVSYQSAIDDVYSYMEGICTERGYCVDYDDDVMYLTKNEWSVAMPVWCSDISQIDNYT